MTTPPVGIERRVGQRFPYLLPLSLRQPGTSLEGVGIHPGPEFARSLLLHQRSAHRRLRNRTHVAHALRDHPGREHARTLPRPCLAGSSARRDIGSRLFRNGSSPKPRSALPCASKATNTSPNPPSHPPPSRASPPFTRNTTKNGPWPTRPSGPGIGHSVRAHRATAFSESHLLAASDLRHPGKTSFQLAHPGLQCLVTGAVSLGLSTLCHFPPDVHQAVALSLRSRVTCACQSCPLPRSLGGE